MGKPEISDLDRPEIIGDQDISRFDVAVDDVSRMGVGQSFEN